MRDGKPYSAIAHLAEDIMPFVAMANGLRERGFSAPEIYEAELEDGLLILEDSAPSPSSPAIRRRRSRSATRRRSMLLVALHSQDVAGHIAGRAAASITRCRATTSTPC